MYKVDGWTLVREDTFADVSLGETVETFRGEKVTLKGGRPPHKIGSTGRIYVDGHEYFPSVCGLKWVKCEDHEIIMVDLHKCCNSPVDMGHMFGCPNSPENRRSYMSIEEEFDHIATSRSREELEG